jgi:hypothetical protein
LFLLYCKEKSQYFFFVFFSLIVPSSMAGLKPLALGL